MSGQFDPIITSRRRRGQELIERRPRQGPPARRLRHRLDRPCVSSVDGAYSSNRRKRSGVAGRVCYGVDFVGMRRLRAKRRFMRSTRTEQSYHVVTAHRPPWRDACVRATQSRFARFPAHLLRRQSPEGVATQPKQAAEAAAMPTWLGGALDRGVERTPQPPRVLPQSSRASPGDCGPDDGHSIPGVERPPRHKGKS